MSLRTSQPVRPSLDVVGATASLACAVHCAVVAVFLGAMPAAASFLAAPWIEWIFLAASTLIGLASLLPGYRSHGLKTPLLLFTAGIAMLAVLRATHASPSLAEMLVVIVAAGCLVSAHWQNRGAMHRCRCGPAHHH
ncbi:MAG: MerC domain-containing protein [Gemmatimonadaceae bacterium]|nr:MerC domain-containing protein [Gemmatimonadaceae bacterium]